MGWFWATQDSCPYPRRPSRAGPPLPGSTGGPPPGCPMHKKTADPSSKPGECPYRGRQDQSAQASTLPEPISEHQQPKQSTTNSYLSSLNPLNLIPRNLPNAPSDSQTSSLPLEREVSTIPRGDGSGTKWEYPSPQQMYNAMLRKGHHDTPIDAVESMVAWHNYLNEGAWAEILEWERRFGPGLMHGWNESRQGEKGCVHTVNDTSIKWGTPSVASSQVSAKTQPEPELLSLTGRPGDLTPRARMLQAVGYVFPNYFGKEPPFDRHDWIVKRNNANGSSKEVRYVIDYYEAPPEPNGDPAFYLDVRPAVDTPEAAMSRIVRWGRDIWYRGTGAELREKKGDNGV